MRGNPLRWSNPFVHIISHFKCDHVYMLGGVTGHMLPHLPGVPHLHRAKQRQMYKVCCPCKVAFLLIRPFVVFPRSPALLSPLSITRFYRVFLHDVTAAILVSQTNPVGVKLFSYANVYLCSNKFRQMMAM